MAKSNNWLTVTKTEPCPVCGKTDWCGRTADGKMIRCMRVQSAKESIGNDGQIGWLHSMADPLPARKPEPERKTPPRIDWHAKQVKFTDEKHDQAIERFSKGLGIGPGALFDIGCGYDGRNFTFPMYDGHTCEIVGFRVRSAAGKKWAIRGSRNGIFWPYSVLDNAPEPIHICEGPTDTAAMLWAGVWAIGRANCTAGEKHIKAFLRGNHRPVFIWADNDCPDQAAGSPVSNPGLNGANRLAAAISGHPGPVRVVIPGDFKDVREMIVSQHTRSAARGVIDEILRVEK